MKCVLIDDNNAFRYALKEYLMDQYCAEIIGEASCAEELACIKKIHKADFIFMDVMLPGKNGIEMTKELLWHHSHLKIIALTMHVDAVYLTTLIQAGFKGCIFKNDLVSQIRQAIPIVQEGHLFFPKNILLDYKK